eukprot:m.63769 g.63769  ORF g.63769 m.63769 type:complete len:88 (+) comp11598_c0_seq2:285-548(+)
MSRSKVGGALSFHKFLLRQQVMGLYCDLHRAARQITDGDYQQYMVETIRMRFRNHIGETDPKEVQVLVARGHEELNKFKRQFNLASS